MTISIQDVEELITLRQDAHKKLDGMRQERDAAIREAEELRGIVETYGKATIIEDSGERTTELRFRLDHEIVYQASGGSMMVFELALRKIANMWKESWNQKFNSKRS